MNKKYFKIVAAVLVVVAAGWNMKQNNSNVGLSDLALANIEALAEGEDGDGLCNWATREVSAGWEAICINGGPGYACDCGDVKPYY